MGEIMSELQIDSIHQVCNKISSNLCLDDYSFKLNGQTYISSISLTKNKNDEIESDISSLRSLVATACDDLAAIEELRKLGYVFYIAAIDYYNANKWVFIPIDKSFIISIRH